MSYWNFLSYHFVINCLFSRHMVPCGINFGAVMPCRILLRHPVSSADVSR